MAKETWRVSQTPQPHARLKVVHERRAISAMARSMQHMPQSPHDLSAKSPSVEGGP
jgi:hypothetical protein